MDTKKYLVTCLSCKQSDVITVIEPDHIITEFKKMMGTNLLAGRWRRDLSWGFECICGNDNRLSLAEKKDMDILVKGTKQAIKKIADSLKIPDETQFKMEPA